jgi:hypothetical protein
VASLESRIDELYRTALGDFVAARAALAKTLSGADAQRVKKLAKPTLVPWAVNQVYWRSRPVYDRLLKSGEKLRTAQVAALEGRNADLRAAGEAHRRAIADAVQEAEKIAAADGSHPAPDALMRTFEALSMASQPAEPHGRLTKPQQPAGFEALAGVKVSAQIAEKAEADKERARARHEETAREKKESDAARRKREADIRKAEAALERAKQKMAAAEAALKAKRNL